MYTFVVQQIQTTTRAITDINNYSFIFFCTGYNNLIHFLINVTVDLYYKNHGNRGAGRQTSSKITPL